VLEEEILKETYLKEKELLEAPQSLEVNFDKEIDAAESYAISIVKLEDDGKVLVK
jgi:hypothetical protein